MPQGLNATASVSENVTSLLTAEQVLSRWVCDMQVYVHAIRTLKYHLPKSAEVVEKATRDLSDQFRQLADGASTQSQQMKTILSIADSLEMGDKRISLQEFTTLFSDTLKDSIEKILFVSKRSITMVYMLDEAMENLASIEKFLTDIQKINKKVNLLSLNAAIEAVQAGSAGKGFNVVASEVKEVSQHVRELASHMRGEIEKVNVSVKAGYDVLKDVATTDMTQNIEAQDKLNVLLQSLIKQNETFSQVLAEGAKTSDVISNSIGGMIMHMQFQDRNTQCIENSITALDHMEATITQLIEMSRPYLSDDAIRLNDTLACELTDQLKLSAFSQIFNSSIKGENLEAIHYSPVADNFVEKGDDDDDDNIDLF